MKEREKRNILSHITFNAPYLLFISNEVENVNVDII